MRNIQLINITNKTLVLSLPDIKRAYAEIDYCLELTAQRNAAAHFCFVQYSYSPCTDLLFRVTGMKNMISIEQLTITIAEFDHLYKLYHDNFVLFNPTFEQLAPADCEKSKKVWERLFLFFIKPLEIFFTDNVEVSVLVSIAKIQNTSYLYDLATIFDLQYRFLGLSDNTNKYVLSVSGISQYAFVESLSTLFKPRAEKTIILYGFDQHYSSGAIVNCSEQLKELALAREQLYNITLQNSNHAGAQVVELENIDQIKMYLQKTWEGYLIQLVTHFEFNKDQTENNRLFFKRKSVRFSMLMKMISTLSQANELRNDVIIDAITCSNFFDFQHIYRAGVKYLNLSHHDIDTDLAAFYLNELYTGVNAQRIGWESDHLAGKQHLYQVQSNINRCFFSISGSGSLILTP